MYIFNFDNNVVVNTHTQRRPNQIWYLVASIILLLATLIYVKYRPFTPALLFSILMIVILAILGVCDDEIKDYTKTKTALKVSPESIEIEYTDLQRPNQEITHEIYTFNKNNLENYFEAGYDEPIVLVGKPKTSINGIRVEQDKNIEIELFLDRKMQKEFIKCVHNQMGIDPSPLMFP